MASPTPWKRGLKGALFDGLTTRSLPPELCSYTITPVKIPIIDADGSSFNLAADLYQPAASSFITGLFSPQSKTIAQKPRGTILSWCPYGRGLMMANLLARPYASRGYNVLLVSCRGTYGSGGKFEPFRTERVDGKAILKWLRGQGWYRGMEGESKGFVGLGPSYMAFTQFALLDCVNREREEGRAVGDMKGAFMAVSPHDMGQWPWGVGGGALNLDTVRWGDMVVTQQEDYEGGGGGSFLGVLKMVYGIVSAERRLKPVFGGVPLKEAVEKHMKGKAAWLTGGIIMRRDYEGDEYYRPMRFTEVLEKGVDVPVLLMTGWYDVFLEQTVEQYRRLSERGSEVRFVVGPWSHSTLEGMEEMGLGWLERCFGGEKKSLAEEEKLPVRVYVGGVNEWRELPEWPPANTNKRELYLKSGKQLSFQPEDADGEGSSSSFTFDPADPTPTVGGAMLFGGGSVNDLSLASRADVLTFTTTPLEEDVEVMGIPSIELIHESDNPNVDMFVRLSEVDSRGQSKNITEGYKRLGAERNKNDISEVITLDMRNCAHAFQKGTCIRLIIAGATSGIFHRNPGTEGEGGNAVLATELRSARHTVYHSKGCNGTGGLVSRVVLSVTSKN